MRRVRPARAKKTGELERALAADERFVNAMIEDSLSMKSREEATAALRKIKAIYWNKLVGHMENALDRRQECIGR